MKKKLKDYEDWEIEAELRRRRSEEPIPFIQEEVDWNKVYHEVVEGVKHAWINERAPKDFDHYVWETAMQAVYGSTIWAKWNRRIT